MGVFTRASEGGVFVGKEDPRLCRYRSARYSDQRAANTALNLRSTPVSNGAEK